MGMSFQDISNVDYLLIYNAFTDTYTEVDIYAYGCMNRSPYITFSL